ncbi:DUF4124 domain-containing protein [Frateuria defendens]|uniref:DUF4124 domain-containing protein n=1 Tax=Frateuria defendens TaxID=2219559 RepID=UPI00066FEB6C|nr:DUF4124 domain-containing protein [Frateuria defendens]
MRKSIPVVAAIALAAALHVHAQSSSHGGGIRYRWHDAQGLPHYSDSLSTEAMKYGYDLVNDQGLAIQRVPRQLTPQERAAAQQQAAQQAATQRAAAEHARADQQMLTAYPDEAALQRSQQQELDTLDQQIQTTRINLRSQEKALTDLLDRAAEAQRGKQAVPKALDERIAEQRGVVTGQRATLQRQQAARDAAAQKAAAQLQRYRELKAAQAQPPA